MPLARLYFAGMLISFIGSLPLGTLNVAAFHLSVSVGTRPAVWFAIGCVIIEALYVRLSLTAMDWVGRHERFIRYMRLLTILITAGLAIAAFLSSASPSVSQGDLLGSRHVHPLLTGLAMSAINPAQIPFWFAFSALLYDRKILRPEPRSYAVYLAGIAAGSLLASGVFIFGGRFLLQQLSANQKSMQLIVGVCFSLAAAWQLWQLIFPKKKSKAGS